MQTTSQVEGSSKAIRNFHEDGTLPTNGEIFVFGSNLAGIHGAGAAKVAQEQFGAVNGIGEGCVDCSYAIPTKDRNIQTMEIWQIDCMVKRFVFYAEFMADKTFFVTRIGCGLAGYKDADIAPMFKGAPFSCSFAKQWEKFL